MHRLTRGPARNQTQLARGAHHPKTIVPQDVTDDEVADVARRGSARATKRAYTSDVKVFVDWCEGKGPDGLPRATPWPTSQETLARYITARAKAGAKLRTVQRGMVAVRQANRAQGHDPPAGLLLEKTWEGLVRDYGMHARKVAPLSAGQIKAMVDTLGARRRIDIRNRALLLVGFATGMRRSEIVGIEYKHLRWVRQAVKPGIVITIPRSKTDQAAEGREVALSYLDSPYCPARALELWLMVSRCESGPVFVGTRGRRLTGMRLDGGDVCRTVKGLVKRAGVGEAGAVYGGHSLRAGMITEARRGGADEDLVMAQSGHVNLMELRGYNRANILDRSVVHFLGL